jgi:hypothetical protein
MTILGGYDPALIDPRDPFNPATNYWMAVPGPLRDTDGSLHYARPANQWLFGHD